MAEGRLTLAYASDKSLVIYWGDVVFGGGSMEDEAYTSFGLLGCLAQASTTAMNVLMQPSRVWIESVLNPEDWAAR